MAHLERSPRWQAAAERQHVGGDGDGGVIDPEAAGRGFLILDWLRSETGAEEYLMNLCRDSTKYNPFNLVLLEPVDEAYQAWR